LKGRARLILFFAPRRTALTADWQERQEPVTHYRKKTT
jgi:hypothetical protein